MGNSCSCINDLSDTHQSQIAAEEAVLSNHRYDSKNVIFLQSTIRGFITRKQLKSFISKKYNSNIFSNQNTLGNIEDSTIEITSNLNEITKKVYQKLGPYNFGTTDKDIKIEGKPLRLENGALYVGDSCNSERHGKGIQM